jgi:hypothetical protein
MASNAAMIYNPGNSDVAGFRIVVDPNGKAAAIDGAGRGSSELQPDIAQKFFSDLAAAGPLNKLPAGDCSSAKADASTTVEVSASIVVSWNGQRTPALSCVTDPRAVKIVLDATTIQRALYVQAYRKRTMTYGGGYAYGGGGYQAGSSGYESGGRFYIPPFQTGSFNFTNFSSDNFYFSTFDNESSLHSNGPWAAAPPGSTLFTNLPYANPFSGATFTSLPYAWPFSGGPYSSNGTVTPYSPAPYGQSPFVGGPSVYSHP